MEVQDIKQQIREVFDPIVFGFGLTRTMEPSLTTTSFSLGYADKTLGLEIEVEMIEFFMFALLFRPRVESLPAGEFDEHARRQKMYLQQAMNELSIDVSSETKALQKLRGDYRNCRNMAQILARLISDHWTSLSQNAVRWFG